MFDEVNYIVQRKTLWKKLKTSTISKMILQSMEFVFVLHIAAATTGETLHCRLTHLASH